MIIFGKAQRRRNPWRGAVVGALLGATLRPLVILFSYVVTPSLHSTNAGDDLVFRVALIAALGISAFNGLWIGAIAGAIPRPGFGAGLGGLLSACTCGVSCGFRLSEFAVWIVLMGIAGAVAGACGGVAGSASREPDVKDLEGERRP